MTISLILIDRSCRRWISWCSPGQSEAARRWLTVAPEQRQRNISKAAPNQLFDGLCFPACGTPLVYFGGVWGWWWRWWWWCWEGNGRFMDVLCYCASLQREPFFCWQAAWWQRATSLTVCQRRALCVVHQTLWSWQLDAYWWFVRGEINVDFGSEKEKD